MIFRKRTGSQTKDSIMKNVLLIEDSIIYITHVELVLQKWKIAVDVAQNLKEALQMLIAKSYDAILIDIEMLQSLVEINVIRSAHSKGEVLIVVLLTEPAEQSTLASYGINDVILKPCTTIDLEKFSRRVNPDLSS
jgi:DNA-binding response OmpR family regulator